MKKVLLVDDDRQFVEAASRELLRRGFRVAEAGDGLAAIEQALEDTPDVAVVDLVMPRVGGAQVVACFRQNPYLADVPMIVLSGVLAESQATVAGLDVELVLGKGPRDDTARRLADGVERVLQTGRGVRETIAGPPAMAERRQVVELLGVARDLGFVLDGAAAGIAELDARGRVTFANRQAADVLGIDAGSLIGAEIVSVFPRGAADRFRTLLARFAGDTGPVTRAMTVSDAKRALRATLTSVWHAGARQSLVLTLAETPFRYDDEGRPTRLLQYVAHEMRASLVIVEEHLRQLGARAAYTLGPEDAGAFAVVTQETARLLRLLGDARQLHRTLREVTDLDLQPVDLMDVVKDGISGISALAVPQGVEIGYRGPDGGVKVRADRDRVLQVLYNLMLNALRATPRGGTIRVDVSVADGEAVTTVADSGHGIAPDELRQIIAQAERPEMFLPDKGKRVGLGLSIAHQIVEAHGGRVTAVSAPGTGSRFGFALPVCEDGDGAAGEAVGGASR